MSEGSAADRRAAFEQAPSPAGRRNLGIALAVLVVLGVGGAVLGATHADSPSSVTTTTSSSPPPSSAVAGAGHEAIGGSLASLIGLTALPRTAAPRFTLEDQTGRSVSLASLGRSVVVLTFLDPAGHDVAPVTSAEVVAAEHDLGSAAPAVTFLAVDVDLAHRSPAALSEFDGAHGLSGVATWHFLTGSPPVLRAAWAAYGVKVQVDGKTGTLLHTDLLVFIAPGGRLAYSASPYGDEQPDGTYSLPPSQIAGWGEAIAHFARALER